MPIVNVGDMIPEIAETENHGRALIWWKDRGIEHAGFVQDGKVVATWTGFIREDTKKYLYELRSAMGAGGGVYKLEDSRGYRIVEV